MVHSLSNSTSSTSTSGFSLPEEKTVVSNHFEAKTLDQLFDPHSIASSTSIAEEKKERQEPEQPVARPSGRQRLPFPKEDAQGRARQEEVDVGRGQEINDVLEEIHKPMVDLAPSP